MVVDIDRSFNFTIYHVKIKSTFHLVALSIELLNGEVAHIIVSHGHLDNFVAKKVQSYTNRHENYAKYTKREYRANCGWNWSPCW